jgi:pyruvate,orthophosphate dikinase
MAREKRIYFFGDGKADGNGKMKDLLGGKGAGLAEMTNAHLPVPPGFTITTRECNAYFEHGRKLPDDLWDEVLETMNRLESMTASRLGMPRIPCWFRCVRARSSRCRA